MGHHKPTTRADDEALLQALAYRHEGLQCKEIAKRLGETAALWNQRTWNVRKIDIKQSGEPEKRVLAGYW